MTIQELKKWHDTKRGLLVFGLVELLLAYLFASRAIDTGSLIEYFVTFVLLGGGLHNLYKLLIYIFHGNKSKATKAR